MNHTYTLNETVIYKMIIKLYEEDFKLETETINPWENCFLGNKLSEK